MADENTSAPPAMPADMMIPQGKQQISLVELLKALPGQTENTDIKALLDAQLARERFNEDYRLARTFALSGKFEDLKGQTPEQGIMTALAKVQLGRSWGLQPADSIRFVYFANGKPAIETEILASRLREAGFAWDIDWDEVEEPHKGKPWKRCTGCRIWLKRWDDKSHDYKPVLDRKGEPVSEAFTEADADHATIWEKGQQVPLSSKWNFKSWPRDMYFWRAISRIRKYHCTDVLRGAISRAEVWDVTEESESAAALPAPETEAQPNSPSFKDQIIEQARQLDQ